MALTDNKCRVYIYDELCDHYHPAGQWDSDTGCLYHNALAHYGSKQHLQMEIRYPNGGKPSVARGRQAAVNLLAVVHEALKETFFEVQLKQPTNVDAAKKPEGYEVRLLSPAYASA